MASLKFQILKRIDSLKCFGQSKKKAKQEQKIMDEIIGQPTNSLRVPGIYSKSTCDNYKKWSLKFAEWERKKHHEKQYKILDNIPKEHVGEWLREGISVGESGYTTRLKASAIAKIYKCHTFDFGIELPSKKDDRLALKRSRNNVNYDTHFSIINNKKLIDFCSGTGLRRSELEQLRPEQIYFKEGKLIIDLKSKKSYRTTTKGGRGRVIYVLRKYYDVILQAKEEAESMGQSTVFIKVHHAMDVHSYRATFAKAKYQEVISDLKKKCKTIILDYICRDGSGRRYNKKALKTTSENLGHSRLDVVVKHYL